jgi:hypothetical protein
MHHRCSQKTMIISPVDGGGGILVPGRTSRPKILGQDSIYLWGRDTVCSQGRMKSIIYPALGMEQYLRGATSNDEDTPPPKAYRDQGQDGSEG